MIENELYHTVLVLAGIANLSMAIVLLHGNLAYSEYTVYRRARRLVALCFAVFAVGFLLHAHFQWRNTWPAAASALSLSYFHVGGVLFGWSHTSLMHPEYLKKRVVIRDLAILLIGISCYWLAVACSTSNRCLLCCSLPFVKIQFFFAIFFVHALFITYMFYRTYYRVRRSLMRKPADDNAPGWWNEQLKRTVLNGHHSFVIACHLIVLFGIGSIVVTAVFPTQITPYTVLMCMGIAVYCYIFYSLMEYGNVIEAATCAAEDAEDEMRHKEKLMRQI